MKWLNLQDNINLLSIIGAIALVVLTFFVVGIYIKRMKDAKTDRENVLEGEWDGIKEEGNDIPVGWAISFVLLIVWAIWYFLVGYPLNSFSQVGMYNEEVKAYNEKFESKFQNPDENTLLAMGQSIYLVQCSQCHGLSGEGINGKAANLQIWGSENGIIDVIIKGSKGLDYPMGEMTPGFADEKGAKAIAAFVAQDISGIKSTKNKNLVEEGKAQWDVCASCHGDDGKGMGGSAPNLTTYGTSAFVVDVLNRGKHGDIGQMPAFNDGRLSDVQKRAVGEYVISLSKDN